MKVKLRSEGTLVIISESELESYALRSWAEKNINSENFESARAVKNLIINHSFATDKEMQS